MSRHLDNLKRIFNKFNARYGNSDDLVLQLMRDIENCEAIELQVTGRGGTPLFFPDMVLASTPMPGQGHGAPQPR